MKSLENIGLRVMKINHRQVIHKAIYQLIYVNQGNNSRVTKGIPLIIKVGREIMVNNFCEKFEEWLKRIYFRVRTTSIVIRTPDMGDH